MNRRRSKKKEGFSKGFSLRADDVPLGCSTMKGEKQSFSSVSFTVMTHTQRKMERKNKYLERKLAKQIPQKALGTEAARADTKELAAAHLHPIFGVGTSYHYALIGQTERQGIATV